jgi:hypothetical protein
MEVNSFVAILGYMCIAWFISVLGNRELVCVFLGVSLAIGFFVLEPTATIDRIASWCSQGKTNSPKAWLTCFATLFVAMAIDGIGCFTFALPGVGEGADILWAPVSALCIKHIMGASSMWAVLGFVEELLPFTDIIPTATMAWFWINWPFLLVILHSTIPSIHVQKMKTSTNERASTVHGAHGRSGSREESISYNTRPVRMRIREDEQVFLAMAGA